MALTFMCAGVPVKQRSSRGLQAADLKKIVNELRDLHINESTSSQIKINVVPDVPPCEPPSGGLISGMEDSDDNQQTHHSCLGKRKVPCELLCTPDISKLAAKDHI